MALKLNSSGGGSVTIDPVSTASNVTITVPATTGGSVVVADSSGNVTATGGVSGTTGTFSGAVSGTTGTFTGNVQMASQNGGQLAGLRNKIINGNMGIFQRGTAAVTVNSGVGPADRWKSSTVGNTFSTTQGAFVSGDSLYDTGGAQYYTQIAVTSVAGAANYTSLFQPIEDVTLLAGQTVTISFWAKAAAGTPSIGLEIYQNFGTGGSPSSIVTGTGQAQALTTTWTKYSKTLTVPSINGKTLGTTANTSFSALVFWLDAGSTINTRSGSIGQASKTVSIAQVQLEIGSVATPFEHRPIGMELALCQRYYYKQFPGAINLTLCPALVNSTTQAYGIVPFFVPMRITPVLEQSGTPSDYKVFVATVSTNCSAIPVLNASTNTTFGFLVFTVASGLTAGQAGLLGTGTVTGANGYIGWNSEL